MFRPWNAAILSTNVAATTTAATAATNVGATATVSTAPKSTANSNVIAQKISKLFKITAKKT